MLSKIRSKKQLLFCFEIIIVLLMINCADKNQGFQNTNTQLIDISSQFHQVYNHLETAIVVNFKNPENIVVTAMISERGYNILYSVIYYSIDGGVTWGQSINLQDNSIEFPSGDPYLTSNSNGDLYFSSLYNGFTVWKSTDHGVSWFVLSKVPGSNSYDREWIVADTRDTTDKYIYASGKFDVRNLKTNVYPEAVAISRSTNGGFTFSSPLIFLASKPNEALNSMLGMHFTKRGKLLVSYNRFYVDINTGRAKEGKDDVILGKIEVLVSEDKGLSFVEYLVSPLKAYGHSQENKSMKTKGLGGMASYSSSNEEIIYITWVEAINGYGQNVVSSSWDGGKSWSKSIQVNNVSGAFADVSNPNIAVNNKGVLLAVWNDRRNDPKNICFQVMGAFSCDNGLTFEEAFIIDEQSTCPCRDSEGNVTEDCRFSSGGDTQGLTVLPDGNFILVFPSDRNNHMELFLNKINPEN